MIINYTSISLKKVKIIFIQTIIIAFADNPLMYAALALDYELQAWADAMDEDWSP
mgnify:FL=1